MAVPDYYDDDGSLTDGDAWVAIAHETLSLPAARVTWLSTDDGQVGDFSQYMDMKIVCYTKGTTTSINGNLCVQFNNDGTAGAYEYQNFRSNGAGSLVSQTGSGAQWDASEMPGSDSGIVNVFGTTVIDLFDINSGKYKSGFASGAAGDNQDTNSYMTMYATMWKNQAPISEIDIYSRNLGNLVVGCVFSLFGILPRMVA